MNLRTHNSNLRSRRQLADSRRQRSGKWDLILVGALLWASVAGAKPADLGAYPYVKHLIPDDSVEQALGCFVLDPDVYESAREDFANMRVVDEAGTEIPFLVRMRNETEQGDAAVSYDVRDFEVREDGMKTVLEFNARREPVTEIRVLASTGNFNRPVLVEGKSGVGHSGFRDIFRGTYSHVSSGDVQRDGRTLKLPRGTRCAEWRITINNHDNPALTITGVALRDRVHEAVFVNRQPGSYRVLYGGDGSRRPQYDMAAILKNSGNTASEFFRLGAEQDNEDYGRVWWPLRIGGRAVLICAILGMVAVLAWGVSCAAKKVDVA